MQGCNQREERSPRHNHFRAETRNLCTGLVRGISWVFGTSKKKIAQLKRSSKQWWQLYRELLQRKTKCSTIPPLRKDQTWVEEPKQKADLFAETFAQKAELPPEVVDTPFVPRPELEFDEFIAIRAKYTRRILETLDETKTIGPDRIPASILKSIAKEIAVPFTLLCRRLLYEACWPSIWRLHLICPLYKRKSIFMPGN